MEFSNCKEDRSYAVAKIRVELGGAAVEYFAVDNVVNDNKTPNM